MTDLSPEVVGRCVQLVRDLASTTPKTTGREVLYDQARAIVALLPEPVDPDLVEAREICASHVEQIDRYWPSKIRAGDCDDVIKAGVPIALAAIKRGRALQQQENARG